MTHDPEATERVRILLSNRNDVAEKKMVGGLSFLVNGNMCCGVTGTALMIRVGCEAREQALAELAAVTVWPVAPRQQRRVATLAPQVPVPSSLEIACRNRRFPPPR